MVVNHDHTMVNIGIIGLGTVGCGTYEVLTLNQAILHQRIGCPIRIVKVCSRDPSKDRGLDLTQTTFVTDPFDIVNDPTIDIVVELMGGIDLAKDVILAALAQGKHVVTANKDLLARHGNEIFESANQHQQAIGFEASVAGGIPIIKSIQEGLSGNEIEWIAGIINGTANYILTQMMHAGWTFEQALDSAQSLGYAEADPTFDVGGIDAAHKIALLATVAFGIPLQFDKVYTESLETITQADVQFAKELGYQFKQIALARMSEQGVECRVHPALVSQNSLLSSVNGVMNAVAVNANAVGPTLYYGAGAGGFATASAVIADIVDIAKMVRLHTLGHTPFFANQNMQNKITLLDESDFHSSFYLRFNVQDEAGTLAKITQTFAHYGVSIESLIQKSKQQTDVPICIITHPVQKGILHKALNDIKGFASVKDDVKVFYVAQLDIGESA